MNNKGQALVEYVLIIAIVSVAVVSLVKLFSGYLQDSLTKTSCTMVGKVFISGANPGEGYCSEE